MSWAGSANEVMGRLDKAQALYERQAQLAQGLLGAAQRDALRQAVAACGLGRSGATGRGPSATI
jgi:hypothetical protein